MLKGYFIIILLGLFALQASSKNPKVSTVVTQSGDTLLGDFEIDWQNYVVRNYVGGTEISLNNVASWRNGKGELFRYYEEDSLALEVILYSGSEALLHDSEKNIFYFYWKNSLVKVRSNKLPGIESIMLSGCEKSTSPTVTLSSLERLFTEACVCNDMPLPVRPVFKTAKGVYNALFISGGILNTNIKDLEIRKGSLFLSRGEVFTAGYRFQYGREEGFRFDLGASFSFLSQGYEYSHIENPSTCFPCIEKQSSGNQNHFNIAGNLGVTYVFKGLELQPFISVDVVPSYVFQSDVVWVEIVDFSPPFPVTMKGFRIGGMLEAGVYQHSKIGLFQYSVNYLIESGTVVQSGYGPVYFLSAQQLNVKLGYFL